MTFEYLGDRGESHVAAMPGHYRSPKQTSFCFPVRGIILKDFPRFHGFMGYPIKITSFLRQNKLFIPSLK